MAKVFVEENGVYQIDLSDTVDVIGNLNEKYRNIGNFLSDVDFIAEIEDVMLLIEYKNTDIENANAKSAFEEKIRNGKLYDSILNKYYGSVFYILACKINKPINYIFIVESKYIDSVWRKRVCASVKKRLPYKLQKLDEVKTVLINDFKVMSIQEWNEQYPTLPLTKIGT